MNRLLQHFVADPNAAPSAPASRPPIPAPPQSSGGSYNAGNRGSYQRASPNGPFYYQPPPQAHYQQRSGPFGVPPQHSEGHGPNRSSGPLEEIPLSSQSTGEVYETVDLNADSSQQHRPHPQQQQRLFTPPNRPPQTPNSQGKSFNTPLYKTPTPPASGGSSGSFQHSQPSPPPPFYQNQNTGSTGSAAELFASAPPAAAKDLFAGSPSGDGGNPFRRQTPSVNHGFAAPPPGIASPNLMANRTPPKDPFAASPSRNSDDVFGRPTATSNDPFSASRSGNGTQMFGNDAGASGRDPFAAHTTANNGFGAPPQDIVVQDQSVQNQQLASSESTQDPFASSPAVPHTSPFDSADPSNGDQHSVASADSLFSSPAPTQNGDWSTIAQPATSPAQAHNLFPDAAPSASSLFHGSASQTRSPPMKTRGIASSQFNASTSPSKPQTDDYSSLVWSSQAGIPPSPGKPEITVPPSPIKMENQLTSSLRSMKISTPAKSPVKPGLDVRQIYNKVPTGKRDDDAVSVAPSRMSMLSTLDDSLKLSDMYKQMTGRLEGEKSDLLKVVASQADEIAQLKKQIKSLEQQLKKYRAKDA